jgi:hypothetical protein
MTIDRVGSAACYVALMLIVAAHGAYAASKKMTYESDTSHCKYDVRFDPKKDDPARVSNTLDVAFGHQFALALLDRPGPLYYPEHSQQYSNQVRDFCSATTKRVTELPVLDLPAVEEYRAVSLEHLRDTCDFQSVEARAALGEASALRDYKKSAPKCSRFIEALEGKDTKIVWHEVIDASCQNNGNPDACRANFLAAETKPNAADWIRLKILVYGWGNCSARYLLDNSESKQLEAARAASEKAIRARLRVRAHPCDI